MAGVKRTMLVLVLLVGALLGVRLLLGGDKQAEQSAKPRLRVIYEGRWGHVDLPNGFRLWLPAGWEFDRQRGRGYIFRRIEEVDGFHPNVHVYWFRDPTPFGDWFKSQRSKRRGGGTKILNEGEETTTGRRGKFLIYETKSEQPGGELLTVTKDWLFFGSGGYKGILRCISTARTFLEPYHAIFNEVHARLKKPN